MKNFTIMNGSAESSMLHFLCYPRGELSTYCNPEYEHSTPPKKITPLVTFSRTQQVCLWWKAWHSRYPHLQCHGTQNWPGFITTWSQEQSVDHQALPTYGCEVILTSIVMHLFLFLPTKNLSHFHYKVTYDKIKYFWEALKGHHMWSQALCHSHHLAPTMSLLPNSCYLVTAHKALLLVLTLLRTMPQSLS